MVLQYNVPAEILLRLCTNPASDKKDAFSSKEEAVLLDIGRDLASLAHGHASKARELATSVAKRPENTLVMLPLAPVCSLLKRSSRDAQFDIRHKALYMPDGLLPLKIVWSKTSRRLPKPCSL